MIDRTSPVGREVGKTATNDVAIVPLTAEMVTEVVKLHFDAFAGYMNTRIGTGYVKAFMNWFRQAERSIALAATDTKGKVLGYVIGAPSGYSRSMNRDLFWVAAAGIIMRPWLLFSDQFRQTIMARLRLILGYSPAQQIEPELPEPVTYLVGIGVSPSARGKNIGRSLVEAFEARARELGMRSLQLSVYTDNTVARRLYESCGWQPASSLGPAGEKELMSYFRVLV